MTLALWRRLWYNERKNMTEGGGFLMKKKLCLILLTAALALASCQNTAQDGTTSFYEEESVQTTETQTTESSTAQTTAAETTTAEKTTAKEVSVQIPEGEHIYPFASKIGGENDCYFELLYQDDGTIDRFVIHIAQGEEMPVAWQFRFTERSDFLFVKRTDRKTGGIRYLYVFETYRALDNGMEELRAATSAIFFNTDMLEGIGMTHLEDYNGTEIGYNAQRKAQQLTKWRNEYLNFRYHVQMLFEEDFEKYQYDILYGYVDGEEIIMENDVSSLPDLPFELPKEYGAEKYW